MQITKKGIAGTLESSDVLVTVAPGSAGLEIELESVVKKQYGNRILQVVQDVLAQLDVTNAYVKLEDRGALDCAIRARVEAAVFRATDNQEYQWGKMA